MRKMQRFCFYLFSAALAVLLVLSGCTRTISTPLVEMQSTTIPTAKTVPDTAPYPLPEGSSSSTPTPYPEAESLTETPLITITATNPPKNEPVSTFAPPATFIPTLDPDQVSNRLEGAFGINERPGTNGHSLLQITGWEYGFRSTGYCENGPYRWLDESHLLLFPNVGQEESMGMLEWTQPVVIDLDGNTWLPPIDQRSGQCRSVEWSRSLQALISSQDGNLIISDLHGKVLKSIEGKGYSGFVLSPSGEKVLAEDTWIDLVNDKEVNFGWDAGNGAVFYPAWTQDEERLFNCCYAYGDAASGGSGRFELGGLRQAGRGLSPDFSGIKSRWVLSDTHSMTPWDFDIDDDQMGIVPLFVPDAQAYVDVRDLVGIPPDQACRLTSISPDGNLIWIGCSETNDYLIDLHTYEKNWFTGERLFGWSADSQFALIGNYTNSKEHIGTIELFSTVDRQRQALSDTSLHEPVWSPQGHRLAYISSDGQTLVLVDAQSKSSQSTPLQDVFHQVLWGPGADRLALVAQDGSLWLVDANTTSEPEQISPSIPGAHDVRWSPDGTALSLVVGTDLYIVK